MAEDKPVLISGIQPSGRLHIGNYLGALKHFVDLQNSKKYECYFFIADYHSLTEDYDPKTKRGQIEDLAASYLAAGLSARKSTLFIQSAVPQTAELMWILNTITPMGELRRMTQLKDKAWVAKKQLVLKLYFQLKELRETALARNLTKEEEEASLDNLLKTLPDDEFLEAENFANAGPFTYPVLMAADILLYDAKFVPVGEDQLQHLELARTLARKFNSRFGAEILVEPKPLMTNFPRVMSLQDPKKKMSKSDPKSCLFLDDSPEEIKDKLMRAVTDSASGVTYDEAAKPAISNLMKIYSGLTDTPIPGVEKKFKGAGYAEFKTKMADTVAVALTPFRKNSAVLKDRAKNTLEIFAAGAKKADIRASKKIAAVRQIVGLV